MICNIKGLEKRQMSWRKGFLNVGKYLPGLGLHENRVQFCNKCHEGNLSFLRAIKPFKLLVVMAYWAISYKKLLAIHERDVTPEQAAYPREWHTINMEITSAKWHCWSIVESRTSAHRRQILHHAASVRCNPGSTEDYPLVFEVVGRKLF